MLVRTKPVLALREKVWELFGGSNARLEVWGGDSCLWPRRRQVTGCNPPRFKFLKVEHTDAVQRLGGASRTIAQARYHVLGDWPDPGIDGNTITITEVGGKTLGVGRKIRTDQME